MSRSGDATGNDLELGVECTAALAEAAAAIVQEDESAFQRATFEAQRRVPALAVAEMLAHAHMAMARRILTAGGGPTAVADGYAHLSAALRSVSGAPSPEPGGEELASAILSGLAELAHTAGRHADACKHFEQLTEHLERTGAPLAAAAARNSAGLAALDSGQPGVAADLFLRSVRTYQEHGRRDEESAALHNLALARLRTGDYTSASETLHAALRATSASNVQRRAHLLSTLGTIAARVGDHEQAENAYLEARQLYRSLDAGLDAADMTQNLAALRMRQGRLPEADKLCRAVLDELRSMAVPAEQELLQWRSIAAALTTRSAVAGQQGRFDDAADHLREAGTTYRALGLPRELADVLTNEGYVHMHRGELGAAREQLHTAAALFRTMGMRVEQARLLTGIAGLAERIGDYVEAERCYAQAASTYKERGMRVELAGIVVNLGVVALERGDLRRAEERFEEGRTLYTELRHEHGRATAVFNLARIAALLGDLDMAERRYQEAAVLFAQQGREREASEVEVNLGMIDAAQGNLTKARSRYSSAAHRFHQLGARMSEAHCLHNEGVTYPEASDQRRDLVIPAWMAVDAVRFTIAAPLHRGLWRYRIGSQEAAAFAAAAIHDDPRLLAEVIESARAAGTVRVLPPAPPTSIGGLTLPSEHENDDMPVVPPSGLDLGWPALTASHRRRAAALLSGHTDPTTAPAACPLLEMLA